MHRLARRVRFSINPFLPEEVTGFNQFVSEPAGEGLAIFFELSVQVTGPIEPTTGFVVNVADIDRSVHKFARPVFVERIKLDFRQAKHVSLFVMVELLREAWSRLADKFGPAELSRLSLKLNPFRKIAINSEDLDMVYFGEKFEFAATHTLWNNDFSQERNFAVFGKCANPTGHGHNYIVEVTVRMPTARDKFSIRDFEKTVEEQLIRLLDHKNLNVDVERFSKLNPTVENIAAFAWNKLAGKFGEATLAGITVWENDKTYCSYYGQ